MDYPALDEEGGGGDGTPKPYIPSFDDLDDGEDDGKMLNNLNETEQP